MSLSIKKSLSLILVCVFVFANGYAHKADKHSRSQQSQKEDFKTVAVTDPQKVIYVSEKSPYVIIKLSANPTTGYSWYLTKYDDRILEPVSGRYVPPTSQLVGAGGYAIWKFKIKPVAFSSPIITRIALMYTRPWNMEGDTETQFTVVTGTAVNH